MTTADGLVTPPGKTAAPSPASACAIPRPIPLLAPITSATSPGLTRALVAAWTPTARGSTIAASAKLTLSGSLKVKSAGCTTLGRSTPCTGGVAQNRTAGSTL